MTSIDKSSAATLAKSITTTAESAAMSKPLPKFEISPAGPDTVYLRVRVPVQRSPGAPDHLWCVVYDEETAHRDLVSWMLRFTEIMVRRAD
ncbi:MAG TPA: hypothetical protein VF957_23555 [Bradyrhizobium sp.]